MKREEIYISNAVKIRPTKVGPTGRIGNRPPTREEVALFRPWLFREIEEISPQVVATLGNVPLQALTDTKHRIGDVHGKMMQVDSIRMSIFALYHPASLIYNRSLTDVYEQDVRRLAEQLRSDVL